MPNFYSRFPSLAHPLLLILTLLDVLVADVLPLALEFPVSNMPLSFIRSKHTPRLLLSQILFMVELKPLHRLG